MVICYLEEAEKAFESSWLGYFVLNSSHKLSVAGVCLKVWRCTQISTHSETPGSKTCSSSLIYIRGAALPLTDGVDSPPLIIQNHEPRLLWQTPYLREFPFFHRRWVVSQESFPRPQYMASAMSRVLDLKLHPQTPFSESTTKDHIPEAWKNLPWSRILTSLFIYPVPMVVR